MGRVNIWLIWNFLIQTNYLLYGTGQNFMKVSPSHEVREAEAGPDFSLAANRPATPQRERKPQGGKCKPLFSRPKETEKGVRFFFLQSREGVRFFFLQSREGEQPKGSGRFLSVFPKDGILAQREK